MLSLCSTINTDWETEGFQFIVTIYVPTVIVLPIVFPSHDQSFTTQHFPSLYNRYVSSRLFEYRLRAGVTFESRASGEGRVGEFSRVRCSLLRVLPKPEPVRRLI